MSQQKLPLLLTVRQTAAVLNVHPNTVRNWEREGILEAVRIGNRRDRRFPKATVLVFAGMSLPVPAEGRAL